MKTDWIAFICVFVPAILAVAFISTLWSALSGQTTQAVKRIVAEVKPADAVDKHDLDALA